jgi:methylmalonyl-CoA mutase
MKEEERFLFNNFPSVSAKQWKQKIQFDLRGSDYNSLLTNTNDGITINPFYHLDTFETLEIPKPKHDSKICQQIFIESEKIANKITKNAIDKGANSIKFIAKKPFDFEQLFKNLIEEKVSFIIEIQFLEYPFLSKLISFAKPKNIDLFIDILGNLARTGNWFYSEEEDFKIIKKALQQSENIINILGVDASLYHNSGANNIQQISYALSHFVAYLDKNIVPQKVIFYTAVGSNYFFEISKIRALRYLFNLVVDQLDINCEMKLLAIPATRNKTIYDYNVNILRTTTEKMSAMLGGAEYICSFPYDYIYHKSNDFGERIARNQLLILKEESYFTDAHKMADGAYYIEKITLQLAEKSLVVLKDIDKNGRFLQQIKKGTIQRKIEESAKKEQEQFDKGELVLLGTNKYPNEKDKMIDDLELFPFVKKQYRKTVVKPIIEKRLAQEVEKKRLEKEKTE